MSYSRSTTVDSGPTGDTVVQAVLDLDADLTTVFANLNTHEALTTASHGLTSGEGDIVGTDALQTLTRKTITSPTITGGTATNQTITTPTITGGTATNQTITTPTITGGTATNQTITTPTITGGTATNLVMTTPSIGTASGTNLTLSGLSASLPVFTSSNSTLTSKSVADTLTALGVGSAAFYATIGDNHINVTGDGTNYSIAGTWTEVIDTGSCFSSGVFTAPATGWYVFSAYIYISGITSSHTSGGIYLVLNGALVSEFYGNIYAVSTPSGGLGTGLSQVAYLEATQTAYLLIDISGGTKVIDITGLRFCGYRLK
jgi:hypothetical protein